MTARGWWHLADLALWLGMGVVTSMLDLYIWTWQFWGVAGFGLATSFVAHMRAGTEANK